jgi:uncharacterized protein
MNSVARRSGEDKISLGTPVETQEWVALLDVLRGFALFGVFYSNLNLWFSGRVFLPPERAKVLMSSNANGVAGYLFSFFVFGKFITIFSFLFGLGFAIQLGRADARGASIVPVYLRRLLAMMLIGAAHLFLLWYGDILHVYALAGLSLLLVRRRGDRALILSGLALSLLVPLLASAAVRFVPLLMGSAEEAEVAAKAATSRFDAVRATSLAGLESRSYLTAMRASFAYYLVQFFPLADLAPTLAAVAGKFFLGLVAGRRLLVQESAKHLRLFRLLLAAGLVAGVLGNGTMTLLRYLFLHDIINRTATWIFAIPLVRELGYLGLATVYVAGLCLLFQRPRGRRALLALAPVGRMALTNYLAQSAVSIFIFYGFGLGLIGTLGPLPCFGITALVFGAQMIASRLWLSRFRFGPAEWAWRTMTYGKAQPLRAEAARGATRPASRGAFG